MNLERPIKRNFLKAGRGPGSEKKAILLVDDEPSVRQMLGRVLACEGYSILPAESGEEALRIADKSHVDLVLLDLILPVKNGWDIFQRLTAKNPLLPIVLITARPNQFFPALASGVGALMEKPLDFPKLLKTIQDLLDESSETRLARIAGRSSIFQYMPASHFRQRRKALD